MDAKQQQQIINAFKADPKSILSQIPEDQKVGLLKELIKYGQSTGDKDLETKAAQELAELEGTSSFKCGGKVRAKMKKGKCGCKVESDKCGSKMPADKCGGKTKKVKKGEAGIEVSKKPVTFTTKSVTIGKKGCPCQLKRIGGRLVEVDSCTGLPVHKKGGNIAYMQDPAGTIEKLPIDSMNPTFTPIGKKFYFKDDPNKTEYQRVQLDNGDLALTFNDYDAPLIVYDNGVDVSAFGTDSATKYGAHGWLLPKYVSEAGGNLASIPISQQYNDPLKKGRVWSKVHDSGQGIYWLRSSDGKYAYVNGKMLEKQSDGKWKAVKGWTPSAGWNEIFKRSGIAAPLAAQQVVKQQAEEQGPAKPTWKELFNAGKAKFGGLTKAEATARQNEMLNAGITDFGTVDGYWGTKSKAAWEKYQAQKAMMERQNEADLADLKARRAAGVSGVARVPVASIDASSALRSADLDHTIPSTVVLPAKTIDPFTASYRTAIDNAVKPSYSRYLINTPQTTENEYNSKTKLR